MGRERGAEGEERRVGGRGGLREDGREAGMGDGGEGREESVLIDSFNY